MKKATDGEYSAKEAARRAEEAIRRSFVMPHKTRQEVKPSGARADAQRRRRAKADPKA